MSKKNIEKLNDDELDSVVGGSVPYPDTGGGGSSIADSKDVSGLDTGTASTASGGQIVSTKIQGKGGAAGGSLDVKVEGKGPARSTDIGSLSG